eukprot:CAMPEP_0184672216 /NCGR_PEP_ID=MMETSP0308-20130426/85971_1 /TAXON_ID=38269 /ORGANISM="Gloeochaete witrockiana, Strain SAG 46.84" /LENGTH=655 /DNA_ID=CAMNT_0027119507 /DNA_START=378 /DNA_END=2345 /DNA_ORIENTATION=-
MNDYFGLGIAVPYEGRSPFPNDMSGSAYGIEAGKPVVSVRWTNCSFTDPGLYVVSVTAMSKSLTVNWNVRVPKDKNATNVILMIGDGMSAAMVTAARLVSRGQVMGKTPNLHMDTMPVLGLLHTSAIDSIMSDGANSASAFNTGHKTAGGAVGVYPDSSSGTYDDPQVENFAELIKRMKGMGVGLVTNTALIDSTPAACFGHTRSKNDRAFLVQQLLVSKADIVLGGGRGIFTAAFQGDENNYARGGEVFKNDRDMLAEFIANNYTVVYNRTQMQQVVQEIVADGNDTRKVLGLFSQYEGDPWLNRHVYPHLLTNDSDTGAPLNDQPDLEEMVIAAITYLSSKYGPKGFYLMVEGGLIDKAMHFLDHERMLAEIIEFDEAVGEVKRWVVSPEGSQTMVIVTSDHAQGYDVFGTVNAPLIKAAPFGDVYGSSIQLEKVSQIRIYKDATIPDYKDDDKDHFPDSWEVPNVLAGGSNNHPEYEENYLVHKTRGPYRSPSLYSDPFGLPISDPIDDEDREGLFRKGNLPPNHAGAVHTLQDVVVRAFGPGSEYLGRVLDNTDVFYAMAEAVGLAYEVPIALVEEPFCKWWCWLILLVILLLLFLITGYTVWRCCRPKRRQKLPVEPPMRPVALLPADNWRPSGHVIGRPGLPYRVLERV